jgi:hypothetical protein
MGGRVVVALLEVVVVLVRKMEDWRWEVVVLLRYNLIGSILHRRLQFHHTIPTGYSTFH